MNDMTSDCPSENDDETVPQLTDEISLDIENSTLLWHARKRPSYSPQVEPTQNHSCIHPKKFPFYFVA